MIKEKILEDIKVAMKNKDNFVRDTLRTLNSVFKQIEVDERIQISDERAISLIQTEIKKRNDSIEQYLKGQRQDLVDIEKKEIEVIKKYLPIQLTDEELYLEIKKIVDDIIDDSQKNIGNIMRIAKEKIASKSDGKRISECVKKFL